MTVLQDFERLITHVQSKAFFGLTGVDVSASSENDLISKLDSANVRPVEESEEPAIEDILWLLTLLLLHTACLSLVNEIACKQWL